MKPAATTARSFRTFLLMSQLQAEEIGARIKRKRLERGMTQESMALLCSFSMRSLQDYENGVTIPYKHLPEISKVLDVRQEWFLYGDELEAGAARTLEPAGPPATLDQLQENQARALVLLQELGIAVGETTLSARSTGDRLARIEDELRQLRTLLAPPGRAAERSR